MRAAIRALADPLFAARTLAILAIPAVLSAAPAAAQVPDCSTVDDVNCVPIYACVEPSGAFFRGRAVGEFEGSIEAELTNGLECTGFWRRTADGAGKVYGDCEDGRTFFLNFAFLHGPSGTAVGEGATSEGETVRGWSGANVASFLTDENGEPLSRLRCGNVLYPIK